MRNAIYLKDSDFRKNDKCESKNFDEDRLLGCLMTESKKGELVTFEDILKALRKK